MGGDCSTTCGDGTHTRTRSKVIDEQYGGNCVGNSSMHEDCKEMDCPGRKFDKLNNCQKRLFLNNVNVSIIVN